MVTQLPIFQGYTVDMRLKEFRKADPKTGVEFLRFDTPKGKKLLELYLAARIGEER